MACLTNTVVMDFVHGQLEAEALAEIDAHLNTCDLCVLLIGETARQELDSDQGSLHLDRGAQLGRYLVLELIGRGAMGEVYRAYDPELDRSIAIKVLAPDLEIDGGHERAADRLAREAVAMARVTHQNVISVYEVGKTDHGVFVAMELVEGTTLGGWIQAETRSWREVVAMFLQVGEGLAAAHDAGLVHRDIKPDNLLVGKDGRVRVTDFGLARTAVQPRMPDVPSGLPPMTDALATTLTQTGALLGSPAYMAPEQMMGCNIDARSDQFSYCVALHEALFGVRPFAGKTLVELAGNLWANKRVSLPDDHELPAALVQVLDRGLQAEPDTRYPSMRALLDALSPVLVVQQSRRWLALAVGALVLASVVIGALLVTSGPAKVPAAACLLAHDSLVGVWDDGQRRAIVTSFANSDRPYASDTAARVTAQLDDYADSWVAMRRESCEATHVRHDQSPQMLDRRTACLDRRLGELHAVVRILGAEPLEPELIDHAVEALPSISSIAQCADTEALLAKVPPPERAADRERLQQLRSTLEDTRALEKLGQVAQAHEQAAALLDQARELGYPPFVADTLSFQAVLSGRDRDYASAERYQLEALRLAAQAKYGRLVSRLAIDLVYSTGLQPGRQVEALAIARVAEAALLPSGDELQRANLAANRGIVHQSVGELAEARKWLEDSLAIRRKQLGEHSLDIAPELHNLAGIVHAQGHREQALALYSESRSIWQQTLGSTHPHVAASLAGSAGVLRELGKPVEAEAAARRALEIYLATYGEEHRATANALDGLAAALDRDDPHSEVLSLSLRALQIKERLFGPEHAEIALSLWGLCELHFRRHQYPEAQRFCARALGIMEQQYGKDHATTAPYLFNLGDCFTAQAKWSEAVPLLERAIALFEREPRHPGMLAQARFDLAKALDGLRRERRRATQLLTDARKSFAELGDYTKDDLADLDAYVSKRR